MKTLVVEGDAITRLAFEKYIRTLGYEVTVWADAECALEACQQTFYPLIILDLELCGMDGFELCRRIRALPWEDHSMILAITACSKPADLEAAIDAGVDDYLIKPVRMELLQMRLTSVERQFRNLSQRKQAEETIRQQNEFLEHILESLTHPFYVIDCRDYTVKLANSAATRHSISENSTCYLLTHKRNTPCDGIEHPCPVKEVKNTGKPFTVEHIHNDKDGNVRNVEIHAYPIFDQQGNVVQIIEYSLDITERKRTEEELRESEERFRNTFEQAAVGITHAALDGRFLRINQRFCDIVGYTPEEILTHTFQEITYPDDLEADLAYFHQVLAGTLQTFSMEKRYIHKNGSIVWVNLTVSLACEPSGNPKYVIGVIEDITRRKQAEEALIQERNLLHTLMDNNPDHIYFKDADSRFTRINKALADWFNLSEPEQAVGKTDFDFFTEKHARPAYADEQEVMRTGQPLVGTEEKETWPNGRETWVSTTKAPLRNKEGRIIGTFGVSRDITEHKRAEEEMARLRSFMKNIIDSMPSILVGVDLEGRVTHWNLQAEKVTGVSSEQARGCILDDVFSQLTLKMEKVHRAIQQRELQKDEKVISRIDGETRYADVTVYPLVSNGVKGAVIRVDDVTSRVRFEEIMIQSEKMISIGGLAAGMAHELNNPLTSMLQNTQIVLDRLSTTLPANVRTAIECGITMEAITRFMERREIVKMLETVRSSGERAAQIIGDMLSFSRKTEFHMHPLHDIRKLLDKTVDLASNIYNPKKKYDFRQIEIVRQYDPDLPGVPCEQNKIQQVIFNLLLNAAQAMAEQENRTSSPKIILRAIRDGNMARIEVEDNGPGMPENVCKRVFEPFFTTKEVGVGTGLGLSVAYFIITKTHGGTMSVESEPGKGTKFIVYLPLEKPE